MADFSLIVDLDVGASTSAFQSGISALVGRINAKPPKIKVEIYKDQALKQIAEIRKELETVYSGTGVGTNGFANGFATQLQQAGNNLSSIKTQVEAIAELSKSGGFASGFKDAIPVIDNLKAELASLSTALKEFQGFSLNLRLGGGNQISRNAEFGSSARAAISELKQQARAIEAVFNEVYPLVNGSGGVGKALQGQGALVSRFMDVRDVFKTKGLGIGAEMNAWKEYIAIMKEAAAIRGIDLSKATSGFTREANEVVAATEKIRSGEAQLAREAEQIKSIFGSGINAEALESHLNTINTSIISVKEAIGQIGTGTNSFEVLTQSIRDATTALNEMLNALGKVNNASGKGGAGKKAANTDEKDLAAMNAKLLTYSAKFAEVQRKFGNISAPTAELTASYERLNSLMQVMNSTTATDAEKVSAYRAWGQAIEEVNALLTSVGNKEKDASRTAATAAKEAAAADKERAAAAEAAAKAEEAASKAAAKAAAASAKQNRKIDPGTAEYFKALQQIDNKLATIRQNAAKWTAARSGKAAANYADYVAQANELELLASRLREGSITAEQFKTAIAGIGQQMATNGAAIRSAGEGVKTFSDHFKSLVGQFSYWFSATQVILYLYRALKQMVSASIELESAFAQLKIVTGASDAELQNFKNTAIDLSTELGQSVSEVTKSIETFSRLGYSLPDASALAEYATILANVAAVSPEEATTGMTSIIKGYNMQVSDAGHVADVLVEVGQKYAVSASEMMEAYEKSGAALNATNTSFEKSAGLIAAANAAVQDSSVVGTALKTVSARIRGSKTELDELGESTDDLADGFSKYADEIKALTGFDIMIDEHTFKDQYDMMEGMAKVWDKLTDTQQARISEIFGGTRQLQVISSILGNWEDAAGAYKTAMDSVGAATKANDIYMETAQAHINQFKSAFTAMSTTVMNSDMLTWFVDLGTHAINAISAISKVVSAVGSIGDGIIPKTLLFTTALSKLFKLFTTGYFTGLLSKFAGIGNLFKIFKTSFNASIVNQIMSAAGSFKPLSGTLNGVAAGFKAVWSSMSSLAKFNVIATGVIMGIQLIKNAFEQYRQKREEAYNESISMGEQAASDASNLSQLYSNYVNAKQSYDLNTGSKESLTDATLALAEALGIEKEAVENLEGSFDDLTLKELDKARKDTEAAIISQQKQLQDTAVGGFFERGSEARTLIGMIANGELGYDDYTAMSSADAAEALIKVYDRLLERREELKAAGQVDTQAYNINDEAIALLGPYVTKLQDLQASLGDISSEIDKLNGIDPASKATQSANARADAYTELAHTLDAADKWDNRTQEEIDLWESWRKDLHENNGLNSPTVSQIQAMSQMVSELNMPLQEAYDAVERLGTGINPEQVVSLAKALSLVNESAGSTKDIFNSLSEVVGQYSNDVIDLKKLGYDYSDTVFGNIDTNNRQVITWTEDALKQSKDALMSWSDQTWDEIKTGYKDSISTVWGASAEYDGVEVAFSPILQTEDGAKLLNKDTVDAYFNALFEEAGDNPTKAKLLELDAEGLEIDGTRIKNILADVGETARDTAMAMHFTGTDGALAQDLAQIQELASQYGVSIETILDYTTRFDDFKLDITAEKTGIEALNKAMSESVTSTGVAADSISALKARYQELDSFDPDVLFERTAQGVHLNAKALQDLETEYINSNKLMAEANLRSKAAEYEILTEQINNSKNATADEIVAMQQNRNTILSEIDALENEIAQYNNLTSAYNQWLAAKEQGDERDAYSAIGASYKEIKELMDAGWTNDREVTKYLDLMLSANKRTGDNIRDFQQLNAEIEGTGYRIMDFFQMDSSGKITTDGLANFLDAVRIKSDALGESFIGVNEAGQNTFDFTGDNLQKVADMLGVSTELVEIFAQALIDANWDVQFDDMFADIEERIAGAKDSIASLKDLKAEGKIESDVDFNINVKNLSDAKNELQKASNLLDELKDKNGGKLDINDEAVQHAITVFNSLLAIKSQLELNDSVVMHVDLQSNQGTDIGNAITLLKNYKVAYAELQVALAQKASGQVDVDVDSAEKKVASLYAQIGEDDTITKTIGISLGSEEDYEGLASTIDTIISDKQVLFDLGIGEDEVTGFIEDNSNPTITFKENHTAVSSFLNGPLINGITKTITFTAKLSGGLPTVGGLLAGLGIGGAGGAEGTAHASGTTHGNWGVKANETALVGELGPEMVVRNGRFFTVGAHSAELAHLKRGDIVFNAEQTRQILMNGKITNGVKRGVAYAQGNAYAGRASGSSGSGSIAALRTGLPVTNAAGNATSRSAATKAAAVQAKQSAIVASEALEDQLKKLKEEIDDILEQFEFDIFMAEKQKKSADEIIAIYRKMQETVHNQAARYRSMGVDENNEYIRDLKKQWWEYEEAIREAHKKEYDDRLSDSKFIIESMTHDEAGIDKIIEYWRDILKSINSEIEYYTSQGYDITSDEIQELMQEAWSAEEEIEEILDTILDKINESIDHIQDVFDALHTAAEEWNSSQFLTIDTLQDIIDLGVEYMTCLKEENGMLVINKEAIADMLAAKTQELAVEAGLNYVRRIGLALADNQTEELNRLLNATQETTEATWGLVYANLAFLKLTDDQRAAALKNLDRLRSLADNVSANILNSLNEEDGADAVEKAGDAMKSILDYTKDLIRHEHDEMIKALDDQLDKYKEIIKKKKESLSLTKSELEYNKDIADQNKEISKLQAQIDALAMDDSREAQIKRAKLMEELAGKQEDLEKKQRDHAYSLQTDALDKQSEDFEKMVDERQEAIEKEISSEEKIYQLALKRMQETEWEVLKNQLIAWNTEYGSSLNSEIISSWEAATRAVEQYGSVVDALAASGISKDGKTISDIVGIDKTYNGNEYDAIAKEMEANSLRWFGVDAADRKRLEDRNAELASRLTELGAYRMYGQWYRSDGSLLYSLDENKIDQALAAFMKENSIAWWTASEEQRRSLEAKNAELAGYSNGRITNRNGTWVDANGNALYKISAQEKDEIARSIVNAMRRNSAHWHLTSDPEVQSKLANENIYMANSLSALTGQSVTSYNGSWYMNGSKLYDLYPVEKPGAGAQELDPQIAESVSTAVRLFMQSHDPDLFNSIIGAFGSGASVNAAPDQNSIPAETINNTVQTIQVDASLNVSGLVDDDVLDVIKRYPREVAEQVSKILV